MEKLDEYEEKLKLFEKKNKLLELAKSEDNKKKKEILESIF